MQTTTLKQAADDVLERVTTGDRPVPGVIAMATDRKANIYEGAAGFRMLGNPQPMTTDTVVCIFSCTKSLTGVTAMQLVEEGKLDLDKPAKTYVPQLGQVQVLDGFDDGGQPRLRAPKSDVTTRQLLLHTAGFGYDFFSSALLKYGQAKEVPSVITSSNASMQTPLLFDPGSQWEYGINIDWAGKVVESIRGQRLGQIMRERIFEPLGMNDTAFKITPSMRTRLARIHQRAPDGSLTALPDLELPQDPENDMGGHGLYATVGDYMAYIRMFLNDGAGANGRVLKPETVAAMEQNGLGDMKIKKLEAPVPTLSHEAEFFPGMPKSWSISFMLNDEDAPTGRPAGSLAWAGLANLFYWIDKKNGIGGFWATQILPFVDETSVPGFLDFETAVYKTAV